MALLSKSLQIKEANKELAQLLGYEARELINRSLNEFIHLEDRCAQLSNFDKLIKRKFRAYRGNLKLINRHGVKVYATISATLNSTHETTENQILIFIDDRTQEVASNKSLKHALIKLRKAEGIAKVGHWSYRLSDHFITWSDQLWSIFERDPQDTVITNEKLMSWIRPDYVEQYPKIFAKMLEMRPGSKIDDIIYPISTPNGQEKWIQVSLEAEFDENGQPQHFFGIVHDITDSYTHMQSIETLNNELSRSNEDLERFAYVASHDLKAPLRAIKNLASWVSEDLQDVADFNSKRHLALLENRVQRMEGLLDGLLQYSRVGQVEADITCINMSEFIAEIWNVLITSSEINVGLQAKIDIACVNTAQTPLHLILTNLLGNSIKHGGRDLDNIKIHVEKVDSNYIRVSIEDNGPGIDPRDHDRVFELFQSLTPNDEVESSGIGLSIVKRTIEQYQGSIELASNPSITKGTLISFTWPVFQ